MNWDALSTISELVGAIAVVLTLIYLAIQVRHSKESLDANTKAIRGQVISDVTQNVHDHMNMLLQGHDVAAAFLRFASENELDPKDAFLADCLLSAILIARQNEYFQWRQGLLDEHVFKSLHHVIYVVLEPPMGRRWWEHEGRRILSPDFVEFVEALRAKSQDDFQSWQRAIGLGSSESGS